MDENENEGLSTGKKLVAGAAISVAVPAAVGVAKKLIGDGDEKGEEPGETVRSKRPAGKSSSRRGRSTAPTKRASSTAKRGSGATTRSSSRRRSSTARSKSRSSSSGSQSARSSSRGSSRTKEQLYNQAKRLGIEGRSTMTKAQLERAIGRARS